MQGKLPPGRYGASRQNDEKEPIVREVVINDAPAQTRYNLTKRPVQDDIARRTNTLIVTRGRYYPPGLPQDDTEPPLRLKILPGGNLPPVSLTSPWLSGQCLLNPFLEVSTCISHGQEQHQGVLAQQWSICMQQHVMIIFDHVLKSLCL